MANFGDHLRELGALDRLASMDTPIHRLDPRAKVLATLLFILMVASFGRYEVSGLLPFALFPVILGTLGEVPWGLVGKRVLMVLPFALVLGILNPFLDRSQVAFGSWTLSAGWLSFASILLRFALCVGASVILIATTSMDGVCMALERLGLPRVFTLQIALLYRYVFVLLEETLRITRARELRANGRPLLLSEYGSLAGSLFLRTWERARRVHVAMLSRGFEGEFHGASPPHFRSKDAAFLMGWGAVLVVLRLVNLPHLLESLLKGVAS
ncbi:cobalt ECF transporter T component CbiQ [Holophaga foetida]|uniref:cobalt ECF transporter T component CbiQ n=1 Tax=Holophaga foetida TaxID=35839 RepID=UPI000247468A|nr:cobalt ECF transporter T component CbiQ [Holophaga foetida]